jgi:hypothetical protein
VEMSEERKFNAEWWDSIFGKDGENINIVSDENAPDDTISVDLNDITAIDFMKNTNCDMSQFTMDKSEIKTDKKQLKLIMEFNFADTTIYTPIDLKLEAEKYKKLTEKIA